MDGRTKIYGIIGNPVSHSKSPLIHNTAFKALRINAAYLPFLTEEIGGAVAGICNLSIAGCSVTIPFKETIIPYLDEIDPVAAKIGAVNTVQRLAREGKTILRGSNTDWIGANRALEQVTSLADKRVLILGAGGSARAIGFGLLEAGARVELASRTESRGRTLAAALSCPWISLSNLEKQKLDYDIVVNTTSVGMNEDKSLLATTQLTGVSVVMDIVYSPVITTLLSNAKNAGCAIISGIDMLLYQGVEQFELWTGENAPVQEMRDVLCACKD